MVSTGEASTNTVVLVHHTGHAVKSEAVEMVHFHPEAEVAEQETHDFVVPIIKQTTVPEVVLSLASRVEVQVVGTVKAIQAIQHVLASMGVHNIK